jgi:hypothetical protein
MNAFDNHVRNALEYIQQVYDELYRIKFDPQGYGIEIFVGIDDKTWWSDDQSSGLYAISSHIQCVAEIVAEPTQEDLEAHLQKDSSGSAHDNKKKVQYILDLVAQAEKALGGTTLDVPVKNWSKSPL